ncbi:NAD(P)-binding protein [Lentithecium fluviatile CBS 122367]|uniref:NAD(P)-binding protein n=1 Tax=Lentithecium fluviatile CBS 122367 TaxID=1168545 RepID=A0A6G1IMJ6_9PLEO|nr:NAD(P)-binding protein [Lentithecium fluviatile CBS 122367]
MSQSTRVLVTGGSGFLGGHIVQHLFQDPATTVAIVSRKPKSTSSDARISYHAADITDETRIKALFDEIKPHAVIHTVSPHHTDAASALIRTNIDGTKTLLKAAKACHETQAFVYTSSDSALQPTQVPLTEDKAVLYTETHYVRCYGMTKAVADALVQAANGSELGTAVIRLPSIYGEDDTNFLPQLVSGLRKKEHKMQVGKNKKVFEFVYVKKAAEAHILASRALLDSQKAPAVAGQAFFISDGIPQPFFDFARKCYAAAGSPVKPEEVTSIPLGAMKVMASLGEWIYFIFTLGAKTPTLRRDGIDHLDGGACWSIEKARRILGYEPVADQDEAIKISMDWAMKNC